LEQPAKAVIIKNKDNTKLNFFNIKLPPKCITDSKRILYKNKRDCKRCKDNVKKREEKFFFPLLPV
jgi:hypothetical protein